MSPSPAPSTPSACQNPSDTLRRDAALTLGAMALFLVTAVALATVAADMGAWFAPKALALFAGAAACAWWGLPAHRPHASFGAANGITALRLTLIALLAAGVGEPTTPALAWASLGLATLAALLDAVDGPIARGRQQSSAFGARFDMETDALLVLVLSVTVYSLGQAGAWVLAAGAMRYVFMLAAVPWPWLAAPLPPSRRRKTVCVVQIVSLIVCLAPIIPPEWARWIAGAGLAALVYSFAVDTVWLARRRPSARKATP